MMIAYNTRTQKALISDIHIQSVLTVFITIMSVSIIS